MFACVACIAIICESRAVSQSAFKIYLQILLPESLHLLNKRPLKTKDYLLPLLVPKKTKAEEEGGDKKNTWSVLAPSCPVLSALPSYHATSAFCVELAFKDEILI